VCVCVAAITKLQDWQDDEILFEYVSLPAILKYVTAVVYAPLSPVPCPLSCPLYIKSLTDVNVEVPM
jgi:hypothetical protein